MKRNKNEECKESQIKAIYVFGFKLCFVKKHNLKESISNPKIRKYTNYNITEIYINRISNKTQIS